jgi:hypothetical protein
VQRARKLARLQQCRGHIALLSSDVLSAWLSVSDANSMSATRWLTGGYADGLLADLRLKVLQVLCYPQLHVQNLGLIWPVCTCISRRWARKSFKRFCLFMRVDTSARIIAHRKPADSSGLGTTSTVSQR